MNTDSKTEKILVRGPDTVGSFVLASPFYRELRRNFPSAYIALAIKPLVYELAKDCPYVNEIFVYDDKTRGKYFSWLREKKFSVSFLLSGSFSSVLWVYLAGIKKRIGYSHDHRSWLLTDIIPDDSGKLQIDYYLYMLEYRGLKVVERQPEIYLKPTSTAFDNFFSGKMTVGISFTAAGELARSWPRDHAVVLVEKLLQDNFQVVFFGMEKDRSYGDYIRGKIKNDDFINLAGRTSLTDFISLVQRCAGYISVASGGLHLAAVLGLKCVGLYCPGDDAVWRPYEKNVVVITHRVDCAPCNQHKMKYCRNNKCMRIITPEEVYEKFKEMV